MSDNVEDLLAQRGQQWGDAIGTHVRIAKVWDGIANREEITALKVALMMEGLKLIRADINPDDPDSFHDGQGYGRIAELIAGHRTSLDDKPAEVAATVPAHATCSGCGHPYHEGRCFISVADAQCICANYVH